MGKKKNKNKKKEELEGVEEVIGEAEASEAEETKPVEAKKKEIVYVDEIAVEIDEEVYAKVMHWIDKADGEVSGLGKIVMENGIFRVTSAILLKQENTAVTTDIDGAAVGKAMFELKDEPGTLNWWWHSHVNMAVFWSGTDMDTIHEFGAGGWVLATVLNKKREMRSCYYQKGAGHIPAILIDDIDTSTIFMAPSETFKEWDEEFKAKVDEKKFKGWTWRETPRGSIGSYTPRESWEGAEVYDGGYHGKLPGNGDESRFNHAEAREGKPEWWTDDDTDGDEEEIENMSEVGNWWTDEEIEEMFQRRLAELAEEAEEANSRSRVRRAKKGKR